MSESRFTPDMVSDPAILEGLQIRIGRRGIKLWRHSCMVLRGAEAAIRFPDLEEEYRSFHRFAEHYSYLKAIGLALQVDKELANSITAVIYGNSLDRKPSDMSVFSNNVLDELKFSEDDLSTWAFKRQMTHPSFFPATASDPADIMAALNLYAEDLYFKTLAQTINVLME